MAVLCPQRASLVLHGVISLFLRVISTVMAGRRVDFSANLGPKQTDEGPVKTRMLWIEAADGPVCPAETTQIFESSWLPLSVSVVRTAACSWPASTMKHGAESTCIGSRKTPTNSHMLAAAAHVNSSSFGPAQGVQYESVLTYQRRTVCSWERSGRDGPSDLDC
jgi:hypothetical protein